jgi:hypothetical protein
MNEPARTRTEKAVAMRLKRMNQIPDVCDDAPYGTQMWSKFGATQHHRLFLRFQTHRGECGSGTGTENIGLSSRFLRSGRREAGNFLA